MLRSPPSSDTGEKQQHKGEVEKFTPLNKNHRIYLGVERRFRATILHTPRMLSGEGCTNTREDTGPRLCGMLEGHGKHSTAPLFGEAVVKK